MKIQIFSDIHLEFASLSACQDGRYTWPHIPVLGEALCLLGDIGYPDDEGYQMFLLECADRWEHVFFLAGNHEFYNQPDVDTTIALMEEIASRRENLHFLNRTTVDVGEWTFAGCTLWSSIQERNKGLMEASVNDYHRIKMKLPPGSKYSYRLLAVDDTNAFHKRDVAWLQEQIDIAKKANRELVVLTHHAPTPRNTIDPSDPVELLEMSATDLEDLLGPPIALWGYGHTHWSCDQGLAGTRVVSNQHGYCTQILRTRAEAKDPSVYTDREFRVSSVCVVGEGREGLSRASLAEKPWTKAQAPPPPQPSTQWITGHYFVKPDSDLNWNPQHTWAAIEALEFEGNLRWVGHEEVPIFRGLVGLRVTAEVDVLAMDPDEVSSIIEQWDNIQSADWTEH